MHTGYSGTQLSFATAFLDSHPNTRLVTVQLGANDLFLLQSHCAGDPTCIAAGLPGLLTTIGTNMDEIFKAIKASHFHGRLVVVNYYSGAAVTKAVKEAITSHAAADGAIVANAVGAFGQAAASAGGKTCVAGLLNTTPGNQTTCDVHPSQSGAQLLAQSVVDAVQQHGGD